MKDNVFSTEDFEKDSLAVFERLLQGYKRAKQTSTWESNINEVVEKLTELPTDPFLHKLMNMFDFHYLVLSEPIQQIIEFALKHREQMKHTERHVTIDEKYFSLLFLPRNTHLKSLKVYNHEQELCYEQTAKLRFKFRQFLKWIIPWNNKVSFQDIFHFKQSILEYQDLEIFRYSPIVDISSTNANDYYKFFCDYYGKTQFLNYYEKKEKEIPPKLGGQFYTSKRVDLILSLSSSQQVLWAYFVFKLLGLKLRMNIEASMLTKFLLLMNRSEVDDYKNTYYYKLFRDAPYVKEGKNLVVELEKTRLLFKEGNLPTDDIDKVLKKAIKMC